MFRILTFLLLLSCFTACGQTSNDTFRLYFNIGDPALLKPAINTIDSLLYNDIITHSTKLIIVGYADYLGDETSNKTLSENRSQNVLDYLIQMGIDKGKVQLCVGKGEVTREEKKENGYPKDRRVDLVIDKRKQGIQKTAINKPIVTAGQPKTNNPENKPVPVAKSTPKIDISLVKTGETIVMEKLFFYPGSHHLVEQSIPELEKLYNTLEDNPNIKIQIEGHVCCVNTADALDEDNFEMALSENRAKAIYYYLVKRGIDPKRLHYRGFGRSKPLVAIERTLEDENKNRRVEIRVLAQ